MKKQLLLFLFAIVASVGTMFAESVKIGDLYYNLNNTDKTAEVGLNGVPTEMSVNDNSLADWEALPQEFVVSATCPADAAMTGLKSVKVFADAKYINILVEPNMDDITDLEWVPFHIYLDADNSDQTGGYGDEWLDPNSEWMCEGVVFADYAPYSYNPAVWKWWGAVGGSGWEWTDPSVSHDASDCWGAIVCEGQLQGCSSQYVNGKFEIQIDRTYIPATWNTSEFGIGFDILQNWEPVGILPCAAATDENPNGKAAKMKVKVAGASANVVIPASVSYEGTTYSVTSIGDRAFYGCSGLTSVTIPNSVTSIGNDAFSACSGLTSVTIGNSVTSIGGRAFQYCSGLTSVIIPNSVTSIGSFAFNDCNSLTSVTIGNSVTSIGGGAFSGCTGLASVTVNSNSVIRNNLKNIFGSQVTQYIIGSDITSIPNTISKCYSNLTSIVVESGNSTYDSRNDCNAIIETATNSLISGCKNTVIPDNVTRIDNNAFYSCSSLTSVTIPNSVTSIGEEAFYGCSSLTSVTIPNSVTSIGNNAFYNVANIIYDGEATGSPWGAKYLNGYTEGYFTFTDNTKTMLVVCSTNAKGNLTIPNSVTSIGNSAFSGCTGLTSVTIPNSVTSIGNSAFSDCTGLTSVTIPNSVTSIGWSAFSGCTGLTSVAIPNSVTSIRSGAFSGCSGLTSIEIPNSVTSIGDYAFYDCSGLTSVMIPNSVTSIGESAFYGCSGLPVVDNLRYADTYLVEAVDKTLSSYTIKDGTRWIGEYAFSGCRSLTSITIPNSVTSIGWYAFSGCTGLTSVTIPNSVTSIGDYAFSGCSGLTSVTIGNSVTYIGWYAFSGCRSLTSVTIPNSVTSIGGFAFEYCSNLTSVTIGNSVTSIGDRAFDGCSSLTSIEIPNSVTSIGSQAFHGCSSLTKVNITDIATWCNIAFTNSYSNPLYYAKHLFVNDVEVTDLVIPNSVTSIGDFAFYKCAGLNSITIGNSLAVINTGAFTDCENLRNIITGSSVRVIEESAFYGCRAIETITCYSMRPPTVNNGAFETLPYSTIIYVPADYLNTYMMHDFWGIYDVRPIGASTTETTEVKVEPTGTTADVAWPVVENAATYELVIKDKSGNVVCTLIFNANGQLTQIAFDAPARDNAAHVAGFSFTVTGLEEGTSYDLTITAKDGNGTTLDEKTIAFTTSGETGVESINASVISDGSNKVFHIGEVLILRDGKTYSIQGVEVR